MLNTSVKTRIRSSLRRFGYDLVTRRPTVVDLLRQRRIDVVLDVGANEGQYAHYIRSWGYRGRIVSFEPLPAAYDRLRASSKRDSNHSVVACALGAEAGTATLNVSDLTVFSSLHRPLQSATEFDRRAETVSSIEVPVRRLDDVFQEHVRPGERVFLKVDTQGHERDVLAGAQRILGRVVAVQLELTSTALYEGEALAPELIGLMDDCGFQIAQLHPIVFDPSDGLASLLQFDGIFARPPD